jgi:hypothetical protein
MALYHSGYSEAREEIAKMNEQELLAYIDMLYGRDNLQFGDGVEAIRQEAFEQCRREFTNTSSREYEQVQFYTALHNANRGRY